MMKKARIKTLFEQVTVQSLAENETKERLADKELAHIRVPHQLRLHFAGDTLATTSRL